MRTIKSILIVAVGSVCLSAAALAAELTGAEIRELIAGKSVYLETTAASSTATPGRGVIFYAPDGNALYRTAKGTMQHGTWSIKDNSLCIDWKEVPNNACVNYDKQGDTIYVVTVATNQIRAKVLKTEPGNAEHLSP